MFHEDSFDTRSYDDRSWLFGVAEALGVLLDRFIVKWAVHLFTKSRTKAVEAALRWRIFSANDEVPGTQLIAKGSPPVVALSPRGFSVGENLVPTIMPGVRFVSQYSTTHGVKLMPRQFVVADESPETIDATGKDFKVIL